MSAASEKREQFRSALAEAGGEELHAYLRRFAEELAAEISDASPERGEEALQTLVAELAMAAADQRRLRERRSRQAEGIAAAQARGVRFGRPAQPLPEGFDRLRRSWRAGEVSLREAAEACGLSKSAFYSAAVRREQAG